jgi:putative ABC transport system ATP-binding protein
MNEAPIIEVRGVTKSFDRGMIVALRGADLSVARSEFVALVGPSGCGKSTLLHLIAALDRADSGEIVVAGHDFHETGDLNHVRALDIGLIFQLHNLLPTLSAAENVQVPMFESKLGARERRERAAELLALTGLEGKDRKRPAELSGGERQRVAIARALANEPSILLADEPTGSLDSASGARILELMEDLRARRGLTILMVTHDMSVAARADRIVHMLDGRIVRSEPAAGQAPSLARQPAR